LKFKKGDRVTCMFSITKKMDGLKCLVVGPDLTSASCVCLRPVGQQKYFTINNFWLRRTKTLKNTVTEKCST
jgi:hypothetical protein